MCLRLDSFADCGHRTGGVGTAGGGQTVAGMISYRWRLVKMSTAIQNRMHSLLHRHNIKAPEGKIDTGENREWWEKLELSPTGRFALETGNQNAADGAGEHRGSGKRNWDD